MEQHRVKIKAIQHITRDVLSIKTEKPLQYNFRPGQATDVSINKAGWQSELRPFTFTCLPDDAYLEFTIKTYPSHKGVTNKLLELKPNDELILHDVFGAIAYKGEGVFIAGGAGVMENPANETPVFRTKLTPLFRTKVTPLFRSKLTPPLS